MNIVDCYSLDYIVVVEGVVLVVVGIVVEIGWDTLKLVPLKLLLWVKIWILSDSVGLMAKSLVDLT